MTSMRRNDVAFTSVWRHLDIMCLLGNTSETWMGNYLGAYIAIYHRQADIISCNFILNNYNSCAVSKTLLGAETSFTGSKPNEAQN